MLTNETIRELQQYKQLREEADAIVKRLTAEIIAAIDEMSDDRKATTDGYKLSISHVARWDADKKKLESVYPSIWEDVKKLSEYDRLNVKALAL